jgi:hypothetical protein
LNLLTTRRLTKTIVKRRQDNYSDTAGSRDMEFDLIYVNGDNNLPNLKTGTDHWKVQLIETEFYKLMFDVNEL